MTALGTFLTGLLRIDGQPVPLCSNECHDGFSCGRPAGHPADHFGHLCDECADTWATTGADPR
jgi:hypothetical protein